MLGVMLKEEGKGKREEGRGKKEEGRRKREEGRKAMVSVFADRTCNLRNPVFL
ncbi:MULTISPECIES: hypothetical protein [unclassified Microcoleus]|uniref:hypothetical protein n=1 Tax=unclassified Microcoleus TaxID=2642155 RepID=UPI002FD73A5C